MSSTVVESEEEEEEEELELELADLPALNEQSGYSVR
jgi:hypothetical protein